MSNYPTTHTAAEIATIANEMGIKDEGVIGEFGHWSIQGYMIVCNSKTQRYTIKADDETLVTGDGNIFNALEDFLMAEG